jgi:hypothetical protein
LSIVDVMMFNSADDIQNLLQQQELVWLWKKNTMQ